MSTFLRYGLVGTVNSLVGFGAMLALAALGAHYALYTAAGYGLAFVVSYLLNGAYTFRDAAGGPSPQGLGLFVAANGSLLLLVEATQAALIEGARLPEAPAVAAGAAVYFLAGFVLNRRLVFRPA